jgi:hypothetical protein
MKTLSHTETSAPQVLLSWHEDLVWRPVGATIKPKPKHRADEIAAAIAESGNPAGG